MSSASATVEARVLVPSRTTIATPGEDSSRAYWDAVSSETVTVIALPTAGSLTITDPGAIAVRSPTSAIVLDPLLSRRPGQPGLCRQRREPDRERLAVQGPDGAPECGGIGACRRRLAVIEAAGLGRKAAGAGVGLPLLAVVDQAEHEHPDRHHRHDDDPDKEDG